MRVIGLDLSITATGVAEVDGTLSTIRPKTAGDERLVTIRDRVRSLVAGPSAEATIVAMEGLLYSTKMGGALGMVHGAVRVELWDRGIPYVVLPPSTLKKYATGKGNATKADMRVALLRRMDLDVRDDNQVDAWWLRAAGHQLMGHPILPLPKPQVAALEKATWGRGYTGV
jgi:Holliday junction resolvasome RuvABC endonuclease subunit